MTLAVHRELADLLATAALDLSLDHLQEPNRHLHPRGITGLQQALDAHDRTFAVDPARIDAAKSPAALVLERRPAVGPEDVALVQHGVRDLPDRVHGYPQASTRLVRLKPVERLAAKAQPGAVGEVTVDGGAPDGDRHPVVGLAVPADP